MTEERSKKVLERRFVKEINPVGKRLLWTRAKLGLSAKQVALEADVPPSTYCGRENGVRTGMHEEVLVIATILDAHWQSKFKEHFPSFNGKEVRKISVLWILYGGDPYAEEYDAIIDGLKAEIREKEMMHAQTEAQLRSQLNMFADMELK